MILIYIYIGQKAITAHADTVQSHTGAQYKNIIESLEATFQDFFYLLPWALVFSQAFLGPFSSLKNTYFSTNIKILIGARAGQS